MREYQDDTTLILTEANIVSRYMKNKVFKDFGLRPYSDKIVGDVLLRRRCTRQ